MRFVDRNGKDVSDGTRCLAVRNNGDGTSTIYAFNDLDTLVNDMKSSGLTGPETTPEYWKQAAFHRDCQYTVPDGCDSGTCSIGSCSRVDTGDYSYCMCLG